MAILSSHQKFRFLVAVFVAIIFGLSGLLPTTLMAAPDESRVVAAKKEQSESESVKKIKLSFDDTLMRMGVLQSTRTHVKNAGVATLTDLRRKALARDPKFMEGLPVDARKQVRRIALLSLLSSNVQLNAELAKKNINSFSDLVQLTPSKLKNYSGGKLNQQQAEVYLKKALALKQFATAQAGVVAGIVRSSLSSSALPNNLKDFLFQFEQCSPSGGGGQSPPQTPSLAAPVCPGDCDELTDAFSPAVYLIYLLDFLEKSFGERLDTLEEIDSRFYQQFEQLPVSADSDQVNTYVKYSNDVLINLIAELDNKNWKTKHSEAEEEILNGFRGVYKDLLENEPQTDTKVLAELFDSYLREMGVERRDVKFALGMSSSYMKEFADANSFIPLELEAMGKEDGQIDLAALNNLRNRTPAGTPTIEGKDILFRWHLRKVRKTVEQEYIAGIQDQLRIGFARWFSSYKTDEVDAVFKELYNQNSSSSLNDEQKLELREKAKNCVSLGMECPSGNDYVGKPLTPIRGLFIFYFALKTNDGTPIVDQASKDKAQAELTKLHEYLVDKRHKQLVADVCGTNNDCCKTLIQYPSGNPCTDCENCHTQENEPKAQAYAQEQLLSEDELENQIAALAKASFTEDDDFRAEVARRAEEAWRLSVSKAENGFQAKIRTNLLAITLHKLLDRQPSWCASQSSESTSLKYPCVTGTVDTQLLIPQNIQRLADYLFLDLMVTEDTRTTPLAAAISRIHTFVQVVRLGKLAQGEGIDTTNFNKDVWGWLQSYGIWHAAMMVTAYPEAFLIPDVRRNVSPQFASATSGEESNPELFVDQYFNAIGEFRDLGVVATISMQDRTIVFARSPFSQRTFYGVLHGDGTWIGWREVVGAVMDPALSSRLQIASFGERLYLIRLKFFKTQSALNQYGGGPQSVGREHTQLQLLPLRLDGDSIIASESQTSADTTVPTEAWIDIGEDIAVGREFGEVLFAAEEFLDRDSRSDTVVAVIIAKANHKVYYKWAKSFGGSGVSEGPYSPVEVDPGPEIFARTEAVEPARGILGHFLWSIYAETGQELHLFPVGARPNMLQTSDFTRISGLSWIGGSAGFGTEKIENLDNSFYLYYGSPHPAAGAPPIHQVGDMVPTRRFVVGTVRGVGTEEDGRLRWKNAEVASFVIPEQELRANGVALMGSDLLAFAKPAITSEAAWKQYVVRADTGLTINLSLPPDLPTIEMPSEQLAALYIEVAPEDPPRKYLKEYYLHLPMLVAEWLNTEEDYDGARRWLSKIYDPTAGTEPKRVRYPGFKDVEDSHEMLGQWLTDPFNPYALAEFKPEVYLLAVKIAHIKNLLDWADKLFTQDSTESVNRARALYELAAHVLDLAQIPGQCTIDFTKIVSSSVAANMSSAQRERLDTLLRSLNTMPTKPSVKEVLKVINSNRRPEARITAIESMSRAIQAKTTLGEMLRTHERNNPCLENLSEQVLVSAPDETLDGLAEGLDGVTVGTEFEAVDLRFCLPQNPLITLLRWKIESNLAKIRQNRNYAGLPRQLQPYATPVDPTKIVKAAAAGNLDFEELAATLSQPPPIYRYSYLVERAKQLAQTAQQFQNSMFAAIKEGEEAEYTLMKARQDVGLERENVSLQSLTVREAGDSLKLAQKQVDRVEFQRTHFHDLQGNLLEEEQLTIDLLDIQRKGYLAAAITATAASATAGPAALVYALQFAQSALGSEMTWLSTEASYKRREEEWKYQEDLAEYEEQVAYQTVTLAEDRINIANKEKDIADLRLQNASDTVEFLQDRFTNRALYDWMKKNLKRLFRDQLNLAISTAKAAQHALEFERQASLDFINYNYWEEDKKGILGSERLIADIDKMDAYRVSTSTRKKEIEKTISLASVMPVEFLQFRKTGVLDFGTLVSWFDRDFPGHYMRLIRDVNVTVLALVPPNEGIHATLSNNGLSRVMVGAPFEQFTIILRLPESIALSSAFKATGLFELRPESDPMLLPFEGNGVDTTWRLEMPKGANCFDYDTLYDVLFTIRYTALEERDYRAKVLELMGQDDEGYVKTSGVRYFSLRNDFPDQWYYLVNPVTDLPNDQYWDPTQSDGIRTETDWGKPQRPYTFIMDIEPSDFVPNESRQQMKKVTLAIQTVDQPFGAIEESWSFPIKTKKQMGTSSTVELTEEKSASALEGISGNPFGTWTLALGKKNGPGTDFPPPATADFVTNLKNRIQDIWLIIEYTSYAHYNKQ